MEVYRLSTEGIERHAVDDLTSLLAREDGFVWVDITTCDEQAGKVLTQVFGAHPLAVRDCFERSHLPKIHAYTDHIFLTLHAPEFRDAGQIDFLEINQFVGRRYLVTVHEPPDEGVQSDAALRETRAVRERIEAGRLRPESPAALSYAIVSALTRRMEGYVSVLANTVASLERRGMQRRLLDPRRFLEELFRARHELLTIRTIAAQSREIYARMATLTRFLPPDARPFVEDLLDQFDRIRNLCDQEKEFLQELLDFHQTRIADELNRMVKRLTALGTMLVTATLIAGIYGMNFEHMPELGWRLGYPLALAIMAASGAALAWWFHREGWL